MDGLAIYLSKLALHLHDLRIYGAGAIQPDPGLHMAPHFHGFHEIS